MYYVSNFWFPTDDIATKVSCIYMEPQRAPLYFSAICGAIPKMPVTRTGLK